MVAATGTAKKAPMMPARVEPTVTESSTIAACRPMALDCRTGCSTLPSICCTSRINASTSSALRSPLDTRAMTTARAPAETAPIIGIKPVKKVTTASTKASGTPSAHRPRPIKSASTKDTAACAWIKPASVFHTRVKTSVACQPIEAPEYLRTHGKNLSPSVRIKKEIINTTATVTKTDDAADAPEITPDAIDDIWPWMKDIASSISWSTSLASMLNGMSLTMPMSWRSEEHTSELQSRGHLVCRLLLEKKKYKHIVN